ncbi:MAG: hypothetical protein K2H56_00735 [Malacoplasma sp.]|nr:hypothetical protein [Malacoplasma sp.]MDE5775231.1 hypothetical protein [Malacoplasma sp.]
MFNLKNLSFQKFLSFFNGTKPLFKLINESFWKNFFGPFFAFIFPLIFIVILGSILGYTQILAGSLAISPMSITLSSMPQMLFEFKNSSLLKRIGSTPIKPSLFIFVAVLFYFIIIVISIIWCILFSFIMFATSNWDVGSHAFGSTTILNPSFKTTLETVDWSGFIFSEFALLIVGLLMGMMLVSVCKSYVAIQAIGITVIIYSEFLCAMVLPLSTVKDIPALWYIGYILSPFKPSSNLILESWNGNFSGIEFVENSLVLNFTKSDIFNIHSSFYTIPIDNNTEAVEVLDLLEKTVSLILPFVWMIIFSVVSIKYFKWSSR